MKRSFLAFALIAFFFAGTVSAQELSKQEKEVWDVVKKEWKLWAEGNMEEGMPMFHDQYLGWNNERPMPADKKTVKETYDMMREKGEVLNHDLQLARISVTDEAAVVHYYFGFMGKMDGKEMGVKGRYTEFLVKDDGEWKLLGDFTYMMEGK